MKLRPPLLSRSWLAYTATLIPLMNGAMGSFRMIYRADFTTMMGRSCSAPLPQMVAECAGQISLVSTSPDDGSLVCEEADPSSLTSTSHTGLACHVECPTASKSVAQCEEAFGVGSFEDYDEYASLFYSCDADKAADTFSTFGVVPMGDGSCVSSSGFFPNILYHLSRLQVFCPDLAALRDPTNIDPNPFVNDDSFFECENADAFVPEVFRGRDGHEGTCLVGNNCGGDACVVDYGGETMYAHASIAEVVECIQELNPTEVSVPDVIEEPTSEHTPVIPGIRSAQYSAGFGLFLKNDFTWSTSTSDGCIMESPLILRITCHNEGIISFISTTSQDITCNTDGGSILICFNEAQAGAPANSDYRDFFHFVRYECETTDGYPSSVVEYEEEELNCNFFGIFGEFAALHTLQLGLFCGSPNAGGDYVYTDEVAECGESEATFQHVDQRGSAGSPSDVGVAFTCFLGIDYTDENNGMGEVLPSLTIHTDTFFDFEENPSCFQFSNPDDRPGEGGSPLANFRLDYRGDFVFYRGFNCQGPLPEVLLECVGTTTIISTNPDNGSLVCEEADSTLLSSPSHTGFLCRTNCPEGDELCESSFEEIDSFYYPEDNEYANVFYACEGDTVDDLVTSFAYLETGEATCTNSNDVLPNIVVHLNRLNVFCPELAAIRDPTSVNPDPYVSDDAFMECENSLALLPGPCFSCTGPTHLATCVVGNNCGTSPCVEDFGREHMYAHVNLAEVADCIQELNPTEYTTPVIDEPISQFTPDTPGTRLAEYSAGFGLFLRNDVSGGITTSDGCTMTSPLTLRITCHNEGTITFVSTTSQDISCETDGGSVLTCTNNAQAGADPSDFDYRDFFHYVRYQCEATRGYPSSVVEYAEESLRCSFFGVFGEFSALHSLQFGIYCSDPIAGGQDVFYTDEVGECGEYEAKYLYVDRTGSAGTATGESVSFTCFVGPDYTDDNNGMIEVIPTLIMHTDAYFNFERYPSCMQFTPVTAASSPAPDPDALLSFVRDGATFP